MVSTRELRVGNVFLIGEDHQKPHLAWKAIRELNPQTVCVELPKEFEKYLERFTFRQDVVADGREAILPAIQNTFQYLQPIMRGLGTFRFVDLPSYFTNTTPLFLEHRFAPTEDALRNRFMSLQAFEAGKTGSAALKVGLAHVPHCYELLHLIADKNPAIQSENEDIYRCVEELLQHYSDEPLKHEMMSQEKYNSLSTQFIHEYQKQLSAREPDFTEAKKISAALSIGSYDIHRRAYQKSTGAHSVVSSLRSLLFSELEGGTLSSIIRSQ